MGKSRIIALVIFVVCFLLLAYKNFENGKELEDRSHPINRAACEFNGKC
ncbi:hypothetical protein DCO58_07085 [Helicobacter saguini]|uniref:Uncharacterized protein n=1 Tax=Helicobacter saguini TaxID=1548018 RepID=A0A6B0HPC5_9HELI|nr:hypothetical protein [Helicobacter saguini]MWV61903.1 hypothetical protein [Helicobacter saguini]MWV67422.1 hypothetical protein [Helicobacter saguini]MWV69775.1 hypothetical protein [Helicobacter saguini]MWV73008.1 hypothetical protein [Helicobacter saguini]